MSDDGWERRLADLGKARELREEIARTLAEDKGILWNSLSEKIGTCEFFRAQADALLSGPLAPLLAAQAAVERVEALVQRFDAPVANGSFPGQTALFGGGDVAYRIRRALDGPT